ncbi:MAG: hypothetical protein HYZ53_07100 [Planctomycetes bacterium]|nr:hypothetical protein [Planctomycetota bacterium]
MKTLTSHGRIWMALLVVLVLPAWSGAAAVLAVPPKGEQPPAQPKDSPVLPPVTGEKPAPREETSPADRPASVLLTPTHGGVLATTKEFSFEIVFHSDRVEIYVRDKGGQNIPLKDVKGTAGFEFPDAVRKSLEAKLVRLDSKEGEWLQGEADLRKIADGEAIARFHFSGLPGKEADLDLMQAFHIVRLLKYVCEKDNQILDQPGTCSKCKAALIQAYMCFRCPKHPEVVSDKKADPCWKCGDRALELRVDRMYGPGSRVD